MNIQNSATEALDNLRTDLYTATLQKEIETTLEELIEALQQAQQQKQGSGGGGGSHSTVYNTPPGSYDLTLTATGSRASASQTLTLLVE